MISGGLYPIPAENWGAIEILIWNYKIYLERAGHTVDIYNTVWFQDAVHEINSKKYDFIHLQFDIHSALYNKHLKQKFCVTSHYGGFGSYIPYKNDPRYDIIFSDVKECPGNIVLSDPIKNIFLNSGYKKFLKTLRNPVETTLFNKKKKGNGKALCLGRIQPRKRQAWLASLLQNRISIDFAGPWDKKLEPDFKPVNQCQYIGTWSKETVYKHLTDYSTLVLLSESEASPLVVLEAMAAGLSVVVTEAASHNLTDEDFITIIPNTEKDPDKIAHAIQMSIDNNGNLREMIHKYVYERFDYNVIIPEYINIIDEFNKYYSLA